MGEPPPQTKAEIDANDRLRRMSYADAPDAHRKVRLGHAAAALATWAAASRTAQRDRQLQPFKAAFTAVISSSTATTPSPFLSYAEQLPSGALPRAMFTPMISSLIVTVPSPSQSPVHILGGVRVGKSVGIGFGVLVDAWVGVVVGISGVFVEVPFGIGVGVLVDAWVGVVVGSCGVVVEVSVGI